MHDAALEELDAASTNARQAFNELSKRDATIEQFQERLQEANEELEKALKFQIAEEVLELFTWSSVKWDFVRGEPPLDVFEPEDLQSRVALSPERLVHEAAVLDAQAARARTLSSGGAVAPPAGCTNGPFVPHGGEFGFFQAPGTDYSVNQEPIIAARLDQLGKALQLHLSGISGYRSPEHSVAVGGFPNDPHTRGEASDTPGVEGVPESTLNQFCLTRPFGGAAEADHIQLS